MINVYRACCKLLILVMVGLLSGCLAGQESFSKGNQALLEEDYDQAVVEFLTAVEESPHKSSYRLKLSQARSQAALKHQENADTMFAEGKYGEALQEYQLTADLDKSLFSAFEGLKRTQKRLESNQLIDDTKALLQAKQSARAKELIERALSLVPGDERALRIKDEIKQNQFALVDGVELEVTSTELIDLNFNKSKLPDAFEVLTQLSGINFILDEDIRDKKITFYLEKATFAQAFELLLRMNKLDKKILNSRTIILYPKTRDKKKQFDDQVIQTFYLSNLDAKKAVNMLRTMLQVRKIHVQEGLNAIVLRDDPDVIRLAQKLIEANDRGDSEVVFDLELIEVNHSDTRNLGMKLSTYSVGMGLSTGGGDLVDSALESGGSASNLISLTNTSLNGFYTLPSATFSFVKTLVDAEVLANPKIRVKNKEKAKVHVGSREPVVTVTVSDGVTSDSVSYIDVGVKLDIEPQIQLDNTVITKLSLEVSNVSGRDTTSSGTAVITISSTNADTTLTLKDGEQTVIGGLIRGDKSTTKNKVPFLGDIPVLGEIFNATGKTKTKREILLSITPHIVKSVQVPTGDAASIWSGGEDDLKFGKNFGTFADEYQTGQKFPLKANAVEEDESSDQMSEPVDESLETGETSLKTDATEDVELPQEPEIKEEEIVGRPIYQTGMTSLLFIEGPAEAKSKEEFEVTVQVENARNLYSTPMTLSYDPQRLFFVGATEGAFLKKGDHSTLFTQTAMPSQGKILIVLKQGKNGQGASGQGELCRLRFRAVGTGEAMMKVTQTDFLNVEEQVVDVDSFETLVKVTQ